MGYLADFGKFAFQSSPGFEAGRYMTAAERMRRSRASSNPRPVLRPGATFSERGEGALGGFVPILARF